MKTRLIRFLLALSFAAVSSLAAAQTDFPSKPIKILVGYPAGGTTDLLARAIAQEAKKSLGQEIIVVNRPGASATIAVGEVIAAAPDGYTIGITPNSSLTVAHFFQEVRPDFLEATTALVSFARMRSGLIVKGDSPLRTLDDFIDYARRNPGKASIGTTGAGTKMSVGLRLFVQEEKLDLNLVPFPGDAPAATAVLGGHVTAGAFSAASWGAQVRAGTMRVLASLEEERFESAPNAPTLIEAGHPFSGTAIVYAYGPKGLPAAVGKRLVDALAEASRSPRFIEIAKQNEFNTQNPLSGDALDRFLIKDRTPIGALVEKLGLKKQ